MSEKRIGIIGLPQTKSGKIVVLPIHWEDISKKKKEKTSNTDYVALTPDKLGFISGGVKHEDLVNGLDFFTALNHALIRETRSEWGVEIAHNSISNIGILGNIQQEREGKEIDYLVQIAWYISLSDQQVAKFDQAAKEMLVKMGVEVDSHFETPKLEPNQLSGFLQDYKKRLRPAAQLALMARNELQGKPRVSTE